MDVLWQDLRYAFRALIKTRGFTVVAILSLALGIGMNASIFNLLDQALLRPLPVLDPEKLVMLSTKTSMGSNVSFSYPEYKDFNDRNEALSGLIAFAQVPLSLSGGETERVWGMTVSGNYFSVLGVNALLGRTLLPDEDQSIGSSPVAVISYSLWQRHFGADAKVLGRAIILNNYSFAIVGVAPPNFTGTVRGFAPDVYIPLMMQPQALPSIGSNTLSERNSRWLLIMGCLKPEVGALQAQANLQTVAEQLAQEYPRSGRAEVVLAAGNKGYAQSVEDLTVPLLLLMGIAGLILIITCANVANLLIARMAARRKEMAVRLALGATRRHLIRYLLTESALLALLSGAAALFISAWATGLVLTFVQIKSPAPFIIDHGLDMRVFGFTLLLSLLAGVLVGLGPAFRLAKSELIETLKGEGRAQGHRPVRLNLRNVLIIAQIAMSIVVLIGAGLFVRTLMNLRSIDAGFTADNVSIMSLNVGLNGYDQPRGKLLYEQLVERVGAIPGVDSVSLARVVPFGGFSLRRMIFAEGYEPPANENINVNYNIVGTKYFQTIGVTLADGRDFSPQDAQWAAPVVIINEAMQQAFWPGQKAVGKRIRVSAPGSQDPPLEIIGVIKNTKYRSLTEVSQPIMYLPFLQNYQPEMILHVRANGSPKNLLASVRSEVQAIDKNLPVFNISTLTEQKSNSLYIPRMITTLLSVLGALVLLLAAMGLFGIITYSVNQRIREIGIRLALGAQKRDIIRLVMRETMFLSLTGAALGLAAAYTLARLLSSLLYGISPYDLVAYISAPLVLCVVGLAATYLPARRAMKVDPVIALRYQ